ncbi:MAG: GNAT family N-acetyltransferase [Micromonosporaceae bacterium]
MSVSVRRLSPDDWKAWRDLRLAALNESPEVFQGDQHQAGEHDEAVWRERLDPDAGLWALASVDAEPVGQVGAWLPFGPPPTLVSLWVRPTWRGSGAGDALVEAVLDWAREQSHPSVELWVMESNEPAKRLYRRHGFVSTGKTMPCPDVAEQEELMICQLGR